MKIFLLHMRNISFIFIIIIVIIIIIIIIIIIYYLQCTTQGTTQLL